MEEVKYNKAEQRGDQERGRGQLTGYLGHKTNEMVKCICISVNCSFYACDRWYSLERLWTDKGQFYSYYLKISRIKQLQNVNQ